MKLITTIFLIIIFTFPAQAQSQCYAPLRAKGDAFAKKGQYERAINMYLAAMNCPEREVGDDLTEQIQKALDARVRQLNAAKRKAEENQKVALKARNEAERQAREALANDFAFKAQIEEDKATAFRLAEHAHKIDTNNYKVLQQLTDLAKVQNDDRIPMVLYAGNDFVTSAKISPDGKLILTSTFKGVIGVWEAGTGINLINLQAGQLIYNVAWHPNGQSFAAAGRGNIKIWDFSSELPVSDFFGHHENINQINFSPDGKYLITVCDDYTAKLWDLNTNEAIHTFNLEGEGLDAGFSPDGSLIITADEDGIVTIWDFETKEGKILKNHGNEVFSASFSPDGTKILTSCRDSKIRIFDLATLDELYWIQGTPGGGYASFSPDGKNILSIGANLNKAVIYDLFKKDVVLSFGGHADIIFKAGYSPDGNYVITCSLDGTARVWPLQNLERRFSIAVTPVIVTNAIYSPDGQFIVAGDSDGTGGTIKVWGRWTGAELFSFSGHQSGIRGLAFSPDGKYLISTSLDRSVRVWDMLSKNEVFNFNAHTNSVLSLSLSSDGTKAVTTSLDRSVKIWDLENPGSLPQSIDMNSDIEDAVFSLDGSIIAVACDDKTIRLFSSEAIDGWSKVADQEIFTKVLEGHENRVSSVDFSPDGKVLVSASWDKSIKFWNVGNGELSHTIEDAHARWIKEVAFSPDGKYCLSASSDKLAKVWDVQSFELTAKLEGHSRAIQSAAWSPDGEAILTAGEDNRVIEWDWSSERVRFSLPGHLGGIRIGVISPDGDYLLTSSNDFIGGYWNLKSRKNEGMLTGHRSRVSSIDFSPDGRWVATGSADQTIKIWDRDSLRLQATIQEPDRTVEKVFFSDNSQEIASISSDNVLRIWDWKKGLIKQKFDLEDDQQELLAFSFTSKMLVTYQVDDRAIHLWDVKSGELIRSHIMTNAFPLMAVFSEDGQNFITSNFNSGTLVANATVYNIYDEEPVFSLIGHEKEIESASFSQDGRKILTGSKDGEIKMWDAYSGDLLLTVKGEPAKIVSVMFHPREPVFYAVYPDMVQEWWMDADTLIRKFLELNKVPPLPAKILDQYNFSDSFEEADINPESLIAHGDEQQILFFALYYDLLSQRAGSKANRREMFEKSWQLLEYLAEKGQLHPPEFYTGIMKNMAYMWDE